MPRADGDFAAESIQRTDVIATLLEHVIGLQFGLIAVNRKCTPGKLAGFDPILPGSALVVPKGDPTLPFCPAVLYNADFGSDV